FQRVEPPMNQHARFSQGMSRSSAPSWPTKASGKPVWRIASCQILKRLGVACCPSQAARKQYRIEATVSTIVESPTKSRLQHTGRVAILRCEQMAESIGP